MTVPYTGKRKPKTKPKSRAKPLYTEVKKSADEQPTISESEPQPREMKDNYQIMKIQTPERVLDSSPDIRKMALKTNSVMKVQPASPSTNATKPGITIIKAPEGSTKRAPVEVIVPSDREMSAGEDDYSDGEVVTFVEDTLHDSG